MSDKSTTTSDDDPPPLPPHRKGISYSQPLDRDAVLSSADRRSSRRKHSLDDSSSPLSSSSRHHRDPSSLAENSARSYSYSYPHPPVPSHHHLRVSSSSFASSPDSASTFTLERAMCEFGGSPGTLPEFVGHGGNSGIFRVPLRAAMHPSRPPPLELRPHPLRETQAGSFLRTIVCERSQLWAGSESGLRVWNLEDVFEAWESVGRAVKRGDEESAPFRESATTSPVLCLAVDGANRFIWSGHKDGKIRCWRMDQTSSDASSSSGADDGEFGSNAGSSGLFSEGLSWQAHHRSPVLCMVITSYGEIWSGSEGGVIKAWPWDAIEKSISLPKEERHMSALLVERSYVDLRAQATVGGVCTLPPSDVKYMTLDYSKSKVWSASSLSFALWDCRKRDLLKVFCIDGHVETRVDGPLSQDPNADDEIKLKYASSSKKEKSHGSMGFLQRSRNALLGAADAVRRVAVKGTLVEDNRRTTAIIATMDGMIWSGCTNGSLFQWDGSGNRMKEFQHHSSCVQCFCTFGTRLWVGYASGTMQVMDLEGNLLGGWVAHSSPVIKMALGGSYIFTLAHHGGVRGWNMNSPCLLDDILRTELASKELSYTKQENIKILAGTWNVGQERASHDSLISWLGSVASEVGLIVIGLQEVEMGAGFLAVAAAKETVGLEGSANGLWWLDNIGRTLDEGTSFQRVGSRQLAGLLIAAWARKSLRPHIGDIDAAAVACGFGRAIGNKGAVGLRMRVFDRVLCFVNCHFAAHLEAVNKRNADFDHVYRTMSFSRPTVVHNVAPAAATSVQLRGVNTTGTQLDDRPELSEADMVVFLGDFNYRLHSITYDEARDMVSQRCFDWLRDKDQLRAEMKAGKVFQGMREAQIRFPPTYKFERHQPGLSGYDSGEKKRIPAWCDRILYRDSRAISVAECSLECPVVASITLYEACMDVTDSDHKPVRCMFDVEIARVDELIRRQEYGEIIASNEKIKALLKEYCVIPESIISTNNIILQNQETAILRITNKCETRKGTFRIVCEGQTVIKEDGSSTDFSVRCSFGFPFWLQVTPAVGIIKPGQIAEVSVQHEEFYTQEEFIDGIPQNWWCEDTRDKEVVFSVNVTGTGSTESRSHRVELRHCLASRSACNNTKASSRGNQASHLHRSDIGLLDNSSDMAEGLCHIHFS